LRVRTEVRVPAQVVEQEIDERSDTSRKLPVRVVQKDVRRLRYALREHRSQRAGAKQRKHKWQRSQHQALPLQGRDDQRRRFKSALTPAPLCPLLGKPALKSKVVWRPISNIPFPNWSPQSVARLLLAAPCNVSRRFGFGTLVFS
jgi:hypothetical protein